jgi:hypothetical protein
LDSDNSSFRCPLWYRCIDIDKDIDIDVDIDADIDTDTHIDVNIDLPMRLWQYWGPIIVNETHVKF